MHAVRRRLALCALLALALPAAAQDKKDYEPHVGQAGKDVIWVPTPDEVVDRMLRMAQVTANDTVVDLGAGDGKIAIAAAKNFGARATGIEYNPDMAKHAQRNAEKAGVAASGYKLLFNVERGGGQVIFHLHLHLLGGWQR